MKKQREDMKNGDGELKIGDIGLFDVPEIDLSLIDFIPSDSVEETRYTKPKVIREGSEKVMYDNALRMAREISIDRSERVDAFVSGNFIFGDFIEAFMIAKNARANSMTVSTLSLNQNNVDSLAGLMRTNHIGKLNLVVSVYFWGNERNSLIPYIYEQLDIDNRFQLAVADIHTKTVHFKTAGGRCIVMHGSANLRSSGNIEQFTIEENPELYEFYEEKYSKIIEKYATINHSIRRKEAWKIMNLKRR